VIILALPRGGVPVAFEVAQRLNAPLDVSPVRKPGVPGREEPAMGAIASGGTPDFERARDQLFENSESGELCRRDWPVKKLGQGGFS